MTDNQDVAICLVLTAAVFIGSYCTFPGASRMDEQKAPVYHVKPLDSAHGSMGLFRGEILLSASSDAVYLRDLCGMLNEWRERQATHAPIVVDSPIGGK